MRKKKKKKKKLLWLEPQTSGKKRKIENKKIYLIVLKFGFTVARPHHGAQSCWSSPANTDKKMTCLSHVAGSHVLELEKVREI